MKTVVNINGDKEYLYPKKVYSYRTVQQSIQDLLNREGFEELLFKDIAQSPDSFLMDLYDGTLYKTFLDDHECLFFQDKRNIGLMLNFDFFNPFKNSQYSLGVLYAVIVNLPRDVRFLWENVIVFGIIPGPKEPKKSINSFLQPLVDNLLTAWSPGIFLKEKDGQQYLYKVAVICVASDLPALRKCCGFLSHNAKQGMCDFSLQLYSFLVVKYIYGFKVILLNFMI